MKKLLLFFFLIINTLAYSRSLSPPGSGADGSKFEFVSSSDFDLGAGDDVKVVFYPNPVKDNLSVKFGNKGDHTVTIYNIIGEKIVEKTGIDTDLIKIDLSDLQKGMYFISYEVSSKVVTKTFSKE